MKVHDLHLAGAKRIVPEIFRDKRGFFFEAYGASQYGKQGFKTSFVQDNHSYSKKGVIRGMHFQSRPGQAKLIRVVSGTICDVIVDIRINSPTFGKWEMVYLDGQTHEQLFIPIGFAHGFCVLSMDAHILYKTSTPYNKETEQGFRFDDPTIGINWPIKTPILSERDRTSPYFDQVRWS